MRFFIGLTFRLPSDSLSLSIAIRDTHLVLLCALASHLQTIYAIITYFGVSTAPDVDVLHEEVVVRIAVFH